MFNTECHMVDLLLENGLPYTARTPGAQTERWDLPGR
jgi:hypothetical protein